LKPWKKEQWVIPPEHSGEFVARMEQVLDVYKRPYDARRPVVCMDESPRQLIRETRLPLAASCGRNARHDYEYERCGVCNVFLAVEPLAGKRSLRITERKTKTDWASFLEEIADHYRRAQKITLVMDNLSTHGPGALYETLPPAAAKALWDRFEFVYTPKHGSWLNMAEIELNVLNRQCLNRRIDTVSEMQSEVDAWQQERNNATSRVDWQFTTAKARVKLKRLYPTLLT
jgi:transposase